MGSQCSKNNDTFYNYNNTMYGKYCKSCDVYFCKNNITDKHCCNCKTNYADKHCCYCKKNYTEWHICQCPFCNLQSHRTIIKDDIHAICKYCNVNCNYKHNCSTMGKIKYNKY